MTFMRWACEDPDDERIMNVTLHTEDNKIIKYRSGDEVSFSTMFRLQDAKVEHVELKNNEWYLDLTE